MNNVQKFDLFCDKQRQTMTIGRPNGYALSLCDGTNTSSWHFKKCRCPYSPLLGGFYSARPELAAAFMSARIVHRASTLSKRRSDTSARAYKIQKHSGYGDVVKKGRDKRKPKILACAAREGFSHSAKRAALWLHEPRSNFPKVRVMLSKTGNQSSRRHGCCF